VALRQDAAARRANIARLRRAIREGSYTIPAGFVATAILIEARHYRPV
jgi:anti-sigma28 factor (negative regulator of flagellin synthesis)